MNPLCVILMAMSRTFAFAKSKPIKVTIPKPTTLKTIEPTCGVSKTIGASKFLQMCQS
jgi:hypothetical protein